MFEQFYIKIRLDIVNFRPISSRPDPDPWELNQCGRTQIQNNHPRTFLLPLMIPTDQNPDPRSNEKEPDPDVAGLLSG